MNKFLHTIIYLLAVLSIIAAFTQCSGRTTEQHSNEDEYGYLEDDSIYVIEAVEEYSDADYALLDTILGWDMDSIYDPNYEYTTEVEVVEEAPAPIQPTAAPQKTVNKVEKPVSTSSLRDKLEERSDLLYEIWSERCDEFNIATVFYDKENNKVNILVALANKDKYSRDEILFITKSIAEFVRQTVYSDRYDGKMLDNDAKLLYDVNPIFRVNLIDSSLKSEAYEYTIKETYDK